MRYPISPYYLSLNLPEEIISKVWISEMVNIWTNRLVGIKIGNIGNVYNKIGRYIFLINFTNPHKQNWVLTND